jgi:hypothetical protein
MLSLFHFEVRYCILASDTNFKSYQGNTFLLLDHKEFLTDDKCLYIFVLIRPFRTSSVLLWKGYSTFQSDALFCGEYWDLNSWPHVVRQVLYHLSRPPSAFCFCLVCFSDRISCFCPRLALDYNPTSTSQVAEIIGVSRHIWQFSALLNWTLAFLLGPSASPEKEPLFCPTIQDMETLCFGSDMPSTIW